MFKNPVSNCCQAPMTVEGDDSEGTHYFVCSACKKACDMDLGKLPAKSKKIRSKLEANIKVTCLNIDCPERTGGKCTAEAKIKDWWDSCDWRKEFRKEFHPSFSEAEQFIETLLIQILAKMESCGTAKECRWMVKEYLLKNGK